MSALNLCVGIATFLFVENNNKIGTHWSFTLVFFGIAGILIFFRDFLPPWFANVFANMLVGVSVALTHRGTWLMVGKPPPDLTYLMAVLILGAVFYQFTYSTPNIAFRISAVSLFRVPFFVSAILALRHSPSFRQLRGTKALICLLLIGVCWYLLRGFITFSSEEMAVLFRTGPMQSGARQRF